MNNDLISRQAVLDGIDTYINKAQSTGTQDDFYSFAELVVKALPPVNPQEPYGDEYIKVPKKALKYRTAGMVAYNVEWLKKHFDIERAVICGAQEPKTGHWKRISIDKYSEHAKYWYRCDRCGKDNLGNTDWCPNCGCRMVEPQESEG